MMEIGRGSRGWVLKSVHLKIRQNEKTMGGRLQLVLMRHPPQLTVETWGGGGGGGGGLGGSGGGGGSAAGSGGGGRPEEAVRGGGSQGGGGYARPTTTICIPPGGMCVWGGLGKLLVAVVKQGLQIGRCVHSGCGDLHFATNDIC